MRNHRANSQAIFLSVWALTFAAGCAEEVKPCTPELLCRHPLNIAHRGGSRLAPENTMPAFANAAAIGADVLETDVHATSDGVIVCIHDEDVDRTTDGTGLVRGMTFAELQALEAGDDFTFDNGVTHPFRGKGVRVPRLDDVLAAFPEKLFSIEIKQSTPSIVGKVLAIIAARSMGNRVVVASFFDNVLKEVRTKAPHIPTSYSLLEMVTFSDLTADEEVAYQAPARVIQAPTRLVTQESLARARRFNLVVQPWTVNDRAAMDALLAQGVDGIITDEPAMLKAAIADANGR